MSFSLKFDFSLFFSPCFNFCLSLVSSGSGRVDPIPLNIKTGWQIFSTKGIFYKCK